MNLSTRFYKTLSAFGMKGIEFPVFYSAKTGIRFDIGDSADCDVYVKGHTINPLYIEHCFDRADRIMNCFAVSPDILAIQLSYLDDSGLKQEIETVLSTAKLPFPCEIDKKIKLSDDEEEKIAILLWDLTTIKHSRETILKEIIKSDLGGEHLLTSSVFWLWSKDKIMFHLYDDRGADLIAFEKTAIKGAYTGFNEWILEYDREHIKSVFEE